MNSSRLLIISLFLVMVVWANPTWAQRDATPTQSAVRGATAENDSNINASGDWGQKEVRVPNVVGLWRNDAISDLSKAGLRVGDIREETSKSVRDDDVISESPVAGAKVKAGSKVNLVIARAPEVKVPDVVGLTLSAAKAILGKADLSLGQIEERHSATVAAGRIISQDPQAGTMVGEDRKVCLVVSEGPSSVTVPNVVGLTRGAATTAITGAGLTLGTVTTQSSSTVAAGLVISETPAAGTSVAAKSAVNLVISSGPAAVVVPNVVGLTQAAAGTAITSAGLTLGTVTTQSSATVAAGLVISESPVAGTSVAAKSAVNLVVSSGAATYTVGGTLSGLPSGDSLTLLDNGGNNLSLHANGTFTFTTALAAGSHYAVTISTQPSGEVCSVSNGSGTIGTANITNVAVACASTATTGSTAFSALSVGNARIAMVPLNLFDSASANTGVAPIAIDGTTVLAGSFVPTSFPIQACSTDSANLVAVCINYSSASVAVLNFSKFVSSFNIADIGETEYETGVPLSVTYFSGAACVICGVVAVSSLDSFIVSAFDGYHVYAYPAASVSRGATLSPKIVYSVPIAENFTLSSTNNWLISPDYNPEDGARPLRVIDLVGQKTYNWTTYTDNCGTSTSVACENFASTYVDAAAFDETTKILVLNNEYGNSQFAVDMSQAVFNPTALTFTAPSVFSDYSTLESQVGVDMSGILASSVAHWSFTVAEFGDAIVGVAQLPAAGGSGGSITLPTPNPVYLDLSQLSDYAPCVTNPVGGRDPHAQGYTLSSAGIPLGLLVSGDSSCVAVINFAVLAKAPTQPIPNENVVDLSAYDPIKAGAVTLYAVPAASGTAAAAAAAARKPPVQTYGAPLPYR